jgi:N-acetylglucosaminyldiphosphoundecaprenol N-acetyl-beta-D-mannosaminyltransferase
MGVAVDSLTIDELHSRIAEACRRGPRSLVFHVNAHALNLAATDAEFRRMLNDAHICFCDGAGVRVAARLGGRRLPPRITYADWIWDFARFSHRENLSWFLLGGAPGRAELASGALREHAPGLRVAGTHHGFFDKTPGRPATVQVIDRINESRADVLIVGFGMPLQERWLTANWSDLRAGVGLTGGAVLDYASGALRRAPSIFTETGFEWLGRLLIEPRRLWRRYLLGNPLFISRAVSAGLRQRIRDRRNAA